MILRKDKVDLARQNLMKTVRSRVRLKYSLLADTEINEALASAVEKFDKEIMKGNLPEVETIWKGLNV